MARAKVAKKAPSVTGRGAVDSASEAEGKGAIENAGIESGGVSPVRLDLPSIPASGSPEPVEGALVAGGAVKAEPEAEGKGTIENVGIESGGVSPVGLDLPSIPANGSTEPVEGALVGDGTGPVIDEIQPTHITVRAISDGGFRRAGRFWPAVETTVPLDELDDRQVEALVSEPELSCVFLVADSQEQAQ